MSADTAAVVLSAGSGTRMGGVNKGLLSLAGEPVLAHSLRALRDCPSVAQITVVMPAEAAATFSERWGRPVEEFGADQVIAGGDLRWHSSRLGSQATDPALGIVAVHDAARPLVTTSQIEAVLAAARTGDGALAAERLADTLKEDDGSGRVAGTTPRELKWRAQTPQAFPRALLLRAFSEWPGGETAPTDEAMLVEALGHHPALVDTPGNFKITTPDDLELAEALLARRAART